MTATSTYKENLETYINFWDIIFFAKVGDIYCALHFLFPTF